SLGLVESDGRSKNLDDLIGCMETHQSKALDWFCANRLQLNKDKTSKMIFSTKSCTTDWDGAGDITFLGVVIDPQLTWQNHIDKVATKLCKTVYLLRNLRNQISDCLHLTVYYALFHSVLSYAVLVWGHSSHAQRLFAIQRRALRIVDGLGYRDDVKQSFVKHKIL